MISSRISAGAVDTKNFHLTAWRNGNAAPPASPFVVRVYPGADADFALYDYDGRKLEAAF